MDWYRDAAFGLFIHWGIYSSAGVEASWPIMAPDFSEAMFGTKIRIAEQDYIALTQRFNPLEFDAPEWVRTARKAGMRYIVITAKHHDGFCMFDAPGTDYKITNTPYGKDICLELAQACADVGMPLGFYYSPPDMHHPGYRDKGKPAVQNWLGEPNRKEWGNYLDYMESHIRKLLTDYGEVKVIWFDGLFNHGKYDPPRFHRLIHNLSPNTLINDRLGDDYDFITPEQFIPKKGIPVRTGKPPAGIDPGGDSFMRTVGALFHIPGIRDLIRQQLDKYRDGTLELTPVLQDLYPAPDRFQPWETCMTMGSSWAHNPDETNWKAPRQLLRNLIEVTCRGGNYLLNVGPTGQGSFPPQAVERLEYIGRWMGRFGESVTGTTYTPLTDLAWGRAARKGSAVYLYVFDWPTTNRLEISAFPGTVRSAHLFAGEPLSFSQSEQKLEITVPFQAPDPDVSVVVVELAAVEKGWTNYSPAKETKVPALQYLKSQALASAWINSVINGLIAFFSYRLRSNIPYAEAAVDILITVAIISFLVSWISIGAVRQEMIKGNLRLPKSAEGSFQWPKAASMHALLIMIVCVILFGGVVLNGLLFWFAPAGLPNWAYIILKTLYTGAGAALASALANLSGIYSARDSECPNYR